MSKKFCGGHTVVVFQLPKLTARVRFPSPAFFKVISGKVISDKEDGKKT